MTENSVDPVATFRARLQELFVLLRRPTYRSLDGHAGHEGRVLRPSTISGLLNGPAVPRWSTVETFVLASARHARARRIPVSPDLVDVDRWHREYRAMENALADLAAERERITGGPVPIRRRLTVPAQLPADTPTFTGRVEQLAALDKLLPDPPHPRGAPGGPGTVVVSAIDGTAGVGKTALAVHWAYRIRDRFPDGQLYVNLRGFDSSGQIVEPATAVRGFLDALDVPPHRIPADQDAQSSLYRSLLAGKRMLIVLDNARDSAQVRPLLPGGAGCLAVVTSRNQLTSLVAAHGAHSVTLDLLTPDEARDLLARRLGAERVAAEPDAADQIIARCARLPLALTLVAAHAVLQPRATLEGLADQLRQAQERWRTLAGDDPSTDVQAVFSWSYQALSPAAAALFRLLGLLPGADLTVAAAASLTATPVDRVRAGLTELAGANLLTERSPGRYTIHDLLRAYATDLTRTTDPDPSRHAATGRLLDHYLHGANTASRLLNRMGDPIVLGAPRPGVELEDITTQQEALAWLTAEQATLLGAVDLAAAAGFDVHTCQLAETLWTFLDRRGNWRENTAIQRTALAAAARLADASRQARAHRLLADAHIRLGLLQDAHVELDQALDLYGRVHDQAARAHTHLDLAMMWERRSRHAEALDHAEQALALYRAVGNQQWKARALNAVGWVHSQLGAHQKALDHCREALGLLQEIDDRNGQAAVWDSLGYAHDHLGHHDEALTCYRSAIELRREMGDRYQEASSLARLGDTHRSAGDPAAARTAYQQALDILTSLDHSDAGRVRARLESVEAGR